MKAALFLCLILFATSANLKRDRRNDVDFEKLLRVLVCVYNNGDQFKENLQFLFDAIKNKEILNVMRGIARVVREGSNLYKTCKDANDILDLQCLREECEKKGLMEDPLVKEMFEAFDAGDIATGLMIALELLNSSEEFAECWQTCTKPE